MNNAYLHADPRTNRRRADRRNPFTLSSLLAGNRYCRRHGARRDSDRHSYYIDWYGPELMLLVIGILLFCFADAVFTLTLLSRGAIEVNPFMAWLIETDIQLFAIIKMALTGVCLIFLVMHINFRIYRLLKVNHVLYACLPLYALLIAYEMVLLTKFATSSISF